MTSVSRFTRLMTGNAPQITLSINGTPVEVRDGDSVATALLLSGGTSARTTAVSGTKRGPYCMMGVCYECLVDINGTPNQQACMTLARDGMRVPTQHGARKPETTS